LPPFSSRSTTAHSARLAQSVARETLNLKVVGSSPTSGSSLFAGARLSAVDLVVVVVVMMRRGRVNVFFCPHL
jgi:hypothetical protein